MATEEKKAAWTPPDTYTRALSIASAESCEAAARPVCVCRCGGALHGLSHAEFMERVESAIESDGEIDREDCFELAAKLARRMTGSKPAASNGRKPAARARKGGDPTGIRGAAKRLAARRQKVRKSPSQEFRVRRLRERPVGRPLRRQRSK